MRFRKSIGALTLAVATTAAGVVGAGPASAATWDHTWYTTDDNPGGRIQIMEHGDDVKVCDTQADGLAARAFIGAGQTFQYLIEVTAGNGHCKEFTAASHDLPEGIDVHVALWLGPNRNYYEYDNYFLNDH